MLDFIQILSLDFILAFSLLTIDFFVILNI